MKYQLIDLEQTSAMQVYSGVYSGTYKNEPALIKMSNREVETIRFADASKHTGNSINIHHIKIFVLL